MNVIIIGMGGHCNVVKDILKLLNINIVGYYDDYNPNSLGKINEIVFNNNYKYFCAIGDNKIRRSIIKQLGKIPNESWLTVIHPSAIISSSAIIGNGTLICAGAILQPNVKIGNHTIINTNSSVDHDSKITDFVHLAPGCTVCGNVVIDCDTFVGAGTTIINNITIGKNSIVGAGSLVLGNVNANDKKYGIIKK